MNLKVMKHTMKRKIIQIIALTTTINIFQLLHSLQLKKSMSRQINIVVKNGGQSLLGWESDGGGEIDKQEGYTGTVEFDFVDFHESVESLQVRILGD
ncbi:hypothetical protein AgCh_019581 [Apium graveolens]